MNVYFLDTSALVKRYVNETGSLWLRALIDPALQTVPIIAQLAVVEITSAFNRRVREGTLAVADYARVTAAFRGDCVNEYQLVFLNDSVVDGACRLIERHPLRTLDALQLATGLTVERFIKAGNLPEMVFISADERLLEIAAVEGLRVDNPNHHP